MKSPRRSDPHNKDRQEMDALLDANPPVIRYRKNNHGVWIAVFIDDPHVDIGCKQRPPKGLRPIDVEYLGDIA